MYPYLPIVASAVVLFNGVVYSWRPFDSKFLYSLALGVNFVIPASQAYLLSTAPKLCVGCLSVTATCLFLGFGELSKFAAVLPRYSMATALRFAAILLPIISGGKFVGQVTGKIDTTHPQLKHTGSLVHKNIRLNMPTWQPSMAGKVIVISNPTCGPCVRAKSDLAGMKVPYLDIPLNSKDAEGHFIFSSTGVLTTPTLILVNPNGQIVLDVRGWPTSQSDQNALIQVINKNLSEDRK